MTAMTLATVNMWPMMARRSERAARVGWEACDEE